MRELGDIFLALAIVFAVIVFFVAAFWIGTFIVPILGVVFLFFVVLSIIEDEKNKR